MGPPLSKTLRSVDRNQALWFVLGALAGAWMIAVSVAGLTWRLGPGALLAAGALAVAAAVLTRRAVGCPSTWLASNLWFVLPLLPVLILAAFVPVYTWDEVAYSVALPRDYAHAGHFFYNADYGPYSAFPGNFEAFTTVGLMLTGNATPAKLLNVAMVLGMALLAGSLFQQLGGRRSWSAVPALLVFSAPAVVTYATVAKGDVASAFFQCLSIVACAQYLERPRVWLLGLAGGFLGVALGTKYASLQFALCLAGSLAVASFQVSLAPATRARHLAIFALGAGLAAAPWYARNLFLLGNPIFPFWNGPLHAANGFGPNQAALTAEMFGGLSGYSMATGSLETFAAKFANQFGLLPLLLGIPGLLGLARCFGSSRHLFLAMLLLSFTVITYLFGFWEPRYVLTLLVLASVSAGLAAERAIRSIAGRWRGVPALATTLLCALGVQREVTVHRAELEAWRTFTPEQFRAAAVPYWSVADWLNRNMGERDKVGVGVNVQPFLYLERPYFHIHPMSEKGDLPSRETPDDFLAAFRSLGLTVLAINRWDPSLNGYPEATAPRLHAFLRRLYHAIDTLAERRTLTLVAYLEGVTIYRIEGGP